MLFNLSDSKIDVRVRRSFGCVVFYRESLSQFSRKWVDSFGTLKLGVCAVFVIDNGVLQLHLGSVVIEKLKVSELDSKDVFGLLFLCRHFRVGNQQESQHRQCSQEPPPEALGLFVSCNHLDSFFGKDFR